MGLKILNEPEKYKNMSDKNIDNQKINNDNLDTQNSEQATLKEYLKMDSNDRAKVVSAYTLLTHLAIQVMVIIVMTFFIGKWLDEFFGTAPLFLLVFVFIGMLSAFRSIYVIGMAETKRFNNGDKTYKSYKKYDYEDEDDETSDF